MRHKIGGQLADRDAIHHQPEMLRPDMIAAHFEAFGHRRRKADRMAAQALLYAVAGFLGELIHRKTLGCGGFAGTRAYGFRSADAVLRPISFLRYRQEPRFSLV